MNNTIWLVDRSRISDGREFCGRARYLNYHFGPTGYGITLKGTKIPLMTGIASHDGMRPIMEWCRDHDELIQQGLAAMGPVADALDHAPEAYLPVPTEVVRAAVKAAQQAYYRTVAVRGFAYLEDDPAVQEITREQCYLTEGMIWAWCLEVLPEILRRGKIVEVEADDVYVVGCTCGLGDGILTYQDHDARSCEGIGYQCKPDFIVEQRTTGELEYHEFKTTGVDNQTFRDKWEVMMQMIATTADVERRLGKHVQSIYVHGLVKGRREGDYNPESGRRDGFMRQQSIFCYGYRRPANPPMEDETWAPSWDYVDDEGKNRKLGKAFKKTGVWELPEAFLAVAKETDPEITPGEFWCKWIDSGLRRKQLILLGPFSRQDVLVSHFWEEVQGEEGRWREGLWDLYEEAQRLIAQHGEGYNYWPDPRFQRVLNINFPRSYACRRYGKRSGCQFEDICLEREGWEDPLGTGRYIPRRPHHQAELDQAIERGLMLPEDGAAEDAEEPSGY